MELAIVIFIATILGILAKFLKQPLILAFILAGFLITYFGFFHLNDKEILKVFSELGIMFLLFLVGLEINFDSLKLIGKTSIFVGLIQIFFTCGVSFLASNFLGFSTLSSIYIALALSFSSTIIVIKILSEKKDSNSLYGKISTGILLTQDFIAIIILVILSSIETGGAINFLNILYAIGKGAIIFALVILAARRIMPWLFDKIAYSQELIFLASLGWCFVLAAIVNHPKIGFPLEISGLLAGLALANSSENYQISTKIKYLRDFFVVAFFVILGSSLVFPWNLKIILPIAVFSLIAILLKPLIILSAMGLMGYRKKSGLLTGLALAQISEFSLVLAAIGFKLGHLGKEEVSIITAVGIITIASSIYLIEYSNGIYQKISPFLSFFQRKKTREDFSSNHDFQKRVILIGSHRLGQSIAYNLKKEDLLIIDFDPEVIHQLKNNGYDYLFGDIDDDEIFERANFKNAKLIISTIPQFKDNVNLIKKLKPFKKEGADFKIIVRAEEENQVEPLYREGANYVVFPHFTSGQYLGKSIKVDPDLKILDDFKEKDINAIKKLERRR